MNGSSSCDSLSDTTSATVPLRRVTSERASRFGTYPVWPTACHTTSCSWGSTLRIPLITRETVARDTPATRATSSSVGTRSPTRTGPPVAVIGPSFRCACQPL
jgi:hypothetical protein